MSVPPRLTLDYPAHASGWPSGALLTISFKLLSKSEIWSLGTTPYSTVALPPEGVVIISGSLRSDLVLVAPAHTEIVVALQPLGTRTTTPTGPGRKAEILVTCRVSSSSSSCLLIVSAGQLAVRGSSGNAMRPLPEVHPEMNIVNSSVASQLRDFMLQPQMSADPTLRHLPQGAWRRNKKNNDDCRSHANCLLRIRSLTSNARKELARATFPW